MFALEVVMQDDFAAVAGENEVNARPLELGIEQQLRVGNDDGVRWDVAGANRMRVKKTAGLFAQQIGNFGIEIAEVIHPVTAMVNKYIISKI
jgi:hypothetical protein